MRDLWLLKGTPAVTTPASQAGAGVVSTASEAGTRPSLEVFAVKILVPLACGVACCAWIGAGRMAQAWTKFGRQLLGRQRRKTLGGGGAASGAGPPPGPFWPC